MRFGIFRAGFRTLAILAFLSPSLVWAQGAPTLLLQWGSSGSGPRQLIQPTGICVDSEGNVYVTDETRVQKFSNDGAYLGTLGGVTGTAPGQLYWPIDAAVDNAGNIYVADNAQRVQIFDRNFVFLGWWPTLYSE